MRLDNTTIVVTGGMGYVGSHTAKCLKAAGAQVIVVDNRHVEQNILKGVEYMVGDYSDLEMWQSLRNKVDGIIHCAGTSLVGPSVQDPSLYYNNNVAKTISMLDTIKDWSSKPFIVFSSSAAVYGNATDNSITEKSLVNPMNPYGNTKMMIERILTDYEMAYGIKSFCYRYFNAAGADIWGTELGPEPDDTHLIPKIFDAYYNKKTFTIYGRDYNTSDGTCVRDYIHVCDLALAHLRACTELVNGSDSKIYNLGTNHGYSNTSVLNTFKQVVGDVKVNFGARREGDPDRLVASPSLIKHELNWKPQFSDMRTIMSSMRKYYEKQ